jgi:hypothetical protein
MSEEFWNLFAKSFVFPPPPFPLGLIKLEGY